MKLGEMIGVVFISFGIIMMYIQQGALKLVGLVMLMIGCLLCFSKTKQTTKKPEEEKVKEDK